MVVVILKIRRIFVEHWFSVYNLYQRLQRSLDDESEYFDVHRRVLIRWDGASTHHHIILLLLLLGLKLPYGNLFVIVVHNVLI